jgi:hypothetical protein
MNFGDYLIVLCVLIVVASLYMMSKGAGNGPTNVCYNNVERFKQMKRKYFSW